MPVRGIVMAGTAIIGTIVFIAITGTAIGITATGKG